MSAYITSASHHMLSLVPESLYLCFMVEQIKSTGETEAARSLLLEKSCDICKMILSPCVFLIFSKFWFFGLLGRRGRGVVRRQKIVQMTKTSVCPTPNFRNYISSWFFLNFFNILIFGVVSGEKRQKMSQNDKQFCLSPSISQEPCITWSSFLIHKCKMIISLGFFFSIFFLILILGLLGGS